MAIADKYSKSKSAIQKRDNISCYCRARPRLPVGCLGQAPAWRWPTESIEQLSNQDLVCC